MSETVEISTLLERGGCYDWVAGAALADVLQNLLSRVLLPGGLSAETVYTELMRRETLMSTACGNGCMLLFPNTLLLDDPAQECLVVCYPKTPLDVKAFDRKPAAALFVLLVSSPERHLQVAEKLAQYMQDTAFTALLREHAAKEALCAYCKTADTAAKKN